jgi:Ca2+-binding EF-hand superfamily protein
MCAPYARPFIGVCQPRVYMCIRSACPGSGFITFDELEDILRRKAKKGPSFLSDEKLRALWCALDSDDSNQIMPQEMGKFLKRAGGESIKMGKGHSNLNKKKIELGGSADLAKGRALECTQTAVLRASLKAELSPEELIELQKTLNLKLTESLHKKSIEVTSAYQLFREIDKDGSGFITWDE